MRKVLGILLIFMVAISGCSGSKKPSAGDPGAGGAKVIKVGAAVSLSGSLSREGVLVKDGYEFWRDKVNAAGGIKVGTEQHKVELIFYDDKSDAQTGAKLTEKLITEDGTKFILGPFSSTITQATSTIAEKYGAITIATLANAPAIYDRGYKYVFSILPPATSYMDLLLDMANSLQPKPKTIAILHRDDSFGIAGAQGAEAKAKKLGMEVVYFDKFAQNVTDLSSLLVKAKAEDPDILLGFTLLQDAILITKQAKDLQLCPAIMGFSVGPVTPDFQKSLNKDANFIYGSEWWLPNMGWTGKIMGTSQQFAKDFEAAKGYTPGYHSAAAAAGGVLLQMAIEKAGTTDVNAVRDAIANFDEMTFYGPLAFDAKGQNRKGASGPVQLQDGKVVSIWPADIREGSPVYPMPCWNNR